MTLTATLRTLFTPASLGLTDGELTARLASVTEEAESRTLLPDAQKAWAKYALYEQQIAHLLSQPETVSSEGEGSRTQGLGTRIAALERQRDAARASFDALTAVTASRPARRRSGSVPMRVEP